MIKKITPSKIVVDCQGRIITIEGEALLPGHGSPDYVIYASSITGWDPPNDRLAFSEDDKEKIVLTINQGLDQRNITYEIE